MLRQEIIVLVSKKIKNKKFIEMNYHPYNVVNFTLDEALIYQELL